MATGLNKVGGNLWNVHNEAAAAKIKARIPLFKVEDERSIMERLMPSTAVGAPQYNASSLASQLQQNLRAKSSTPPSSSNSSTTTPQHQNQNQNNSNSNSTTETSLLTSMTSRLISLEKSHRTLRKELVKKDREVLEWKRKYESIAEAAEDDGIAKAAEQLQEVQRANFLLRGQVHEMESFLQDYGLIWVGANVATDEPSLSENIGSRIDFPMLFRRLNELNTLAGEGKAQISKDGKNARFNFDPEKIPLAVFQDGVLIRRGPFRPFSDKITQQFVSDVLDGYFPPEFKNDYPDGVIFDIKDCSKECYINGAGGGGGGGGGTGEPHFKAFGGQGNKIGGQIKPMSREEFLKRLPEKMISKGRVVNIRDGIASKLDAMNGRDSDGSKNEDRSVGDDDRQRSLSPSLPNVKGEANNGGIKIAETPALTMLKRSATLGELHADEEVTTLRIKLPKEGRNSTGTTSLLLKMYFNDTIGALREHVASNLPGVFEFDLRTSYPSKMLKDDTLTLVEAGLTPNAALIVSVVSGGGGSTSSKGNKK